MNPMIEKTADAFYEEVVKSILKKRKKDNEKKGEDRPRSQGQSIDDDITAFCRMRDKGYSYDEIAETIRKHSPMVEPFKKDKKAVEQYMLRITETANVEGLRRSSNAYPLAEKAYKERVDAIMKKYEGMDKSAYSEYHDGTIAMKLIVSDGFSPEVVENVIQKNSPAAEKNDSYVRNVMDGVEESVRRYQDIQNYSDKEADIKEQEAFERGGKRELDAVSRVHVYQAAAQAYMRDTKTPILTERDEENILNNIFDNWANKDVILKSLEDINVSEVAQNKLIKNAVTEQFQVEYRPAFKAASPVITEPGRDEREYSMSVFDGLHSRFLQEQLNSEKFHEKFYPKVREYFRSTRQDFQKQAEEATALYSSDYLDAASAKKLLSENMPGINIQKALEERWKNEPNPAYRSARDYSTDIMKRAEDSLDAEHEILTYRKEIPQDKTLEELKEKDFSLTDLYKGFMARRLKETPSFVFRMAEPEADYEITERILTKYGHEIDEDAKETFKADLGRVIAKNSPRAKLSIPSDYADHIMRHYEKVSASLKNRNIKTTQLADQFLHARGLMTEGTNIHPAETSKIGNVFDIVKDGRVAVKMLMNGRNTEEIKEALKVISLTSGATVAAIGLDQYVDSLLHASMQVFDRSKRIMDYRSPARMRQKGRENEQGSVEENAADLYLSRMHDFYKEKGNILPSMDIRFAEEMLYRNEDALTRKPIYSKEAVKQLVRQYSPVAAEAGRDDNYADYVAKEAQTNLDIEKEKLAKYQVIPSTQEENTCEQEYDYQRKSIQDHVRLPYSPKMDEKIVTGLLKSDYKMDAICLAVAHKSPVASKLDDDKKMQYAKKVLKDVRKTVEKEVKHEQLSNGLTRTQAIEKVRVRSRFTIEPDPNVSLNDATTKPAGNL